MLLLLDNYDSFTHILCDYLQQLGFEVMVKRNNEITIAEIEAANFEAIVLSPGPNTPKDSGILLSVIENFYLHKPILGVCLGHQAIGEFFGAKLIKAKNPMHGKTSEVFHQGHFLFDKINSPFAAMRYHSLILEEIKNTDLEIIAHTAEGEIMAIAHKTLPIVGVQFHPESVLSPDGLQLLKNWRDSH